MSRSAIRTSAIVIAIVIAGALAHAQRPGRGEDDSAALVAEGREALRRGKLDDAAEALDQAIALNPRRVEAYVLRSGVYAARKQYRAGIAIMRRAQQLAPNDEEVLTALGSQLVLSGDRAAGVPLLQQVVARNPKRYDAQLLLGNHWHAAGQWRDAIGAFEAYFAERPPVLAKEDARHRIDLADAQLRARKPREALAQFQRAIDEQRRESREDRIDLRARLGVAWATAALDCARARPLLRALEPVAAAHPEVWLVDGQCALALGDAAGALQLGRRFLEQAPAAAGGHALVGEALAARGNFAEARKELAAARQLEPGRRRWTVRFAAVLRRSGDAAAAVAALEELGPPAQPSADPDWWRELGEALLAKGDARGAADRLSPVIAELPGDAAVRTALGAAQLAAGRIEPATATLGEANSIESTPRTRKLLGAALGAAGAQKLAANDAAAAERLLVRAEQLDATPAVLRNLGIAHLALDRPRDAIAALDRAHKADRAPVTAMLAARARAISGDVAAARPIYEQALAAARNDPSATEIAIDWAASELLASGDPALAVAALERAAPAAKGPLAQRYHAALADARHAAGIAALRAGQGAIAVELLRAAIAAEASTDGGPRSRAASSLAKRCDLALAAVVAGDAAASLAALRAVSGQTCPFPPPADTQAAPILIAFTEALSAARAPRALEKLTALAAKSSGPAAALRETAVRVVALEAARGAYQSGALARAKQYLQTARNARARAGADEVAHDLAVIDLLEGRYAAAIAALEKLAPKLPDALVSAGIAYEKQGEPTKALDAWRRARKAGVRFAPLADWIDAKERIYGEAP